MVLVVVVVLLFSLVHLRRVIIVQWRCTFDAGLEVSSATVYALGLL